MSLSKNQSLRLNISGFSLVEMMIVVAILAIISSIAFPSFRTMIKNSQIRNAAESIQNGLLLARAEAIKLNTDVTFVLGAAATGSYTSWTVSSVNPASVIQSRSSNEGSKDVTRTVLPANATTVTFNSLGQVKDVAPLTQVDLTAVGGTKNMRVTINIGGNIRMCDPSLSLGSSPRAC